DLVDAFAEVEAVQALAGVDLVVLEADEGQRADIDEFLRPVGLLHVHGQLEGAGLRRLETKAVVVVFGGDVAGAGVEAVGPPKAGAVVGVEWQHLLGQTLRADGADGEVAVEDVEDLGAVFEEEAMAETLVADAVADHEVIGAMDGQPAIVAVPDGGADYRAA